MVFVGMISTHGNRKNVLLVEDNPGDVRLIAECLNGDVVHTHIAKDGVEALAFLRRDGKFATAPCPDLILLDINLPKKDGHEVLAEIRADNQLRVIPLVVLTTSRADDDTLRAYALNANCYVSKPIELGDFTRVVKSIEKFWLNTVMLPPRSGEEALNRFSPILPT